MRKELQMRRVVAIMMMIVALVIINLSILGKEKHLKEGQVVYLKLAPVDPRSLMQGDYMALRFELSSRVYEELPKLSAKESRGWRRDVVGTDGYVTVELDERNVGSFKRIHVDGDTAENEIRMRYRIRRGAVKFASNAFFFQEGKSGIYEAAKYGEFRVDAKGELLLTAMYDEDLKLLGDG